MATSSSFGPLRELGETQLQIQFALFSAYDARAIGVLAIDAALAAVATAAAHSIGAIWWLSLIGLLSSGLTSVSAMKIGGEEKALDIETAFEDTEALGLDAMDRLLAISIADAIQERRNSADQENVDERGRSPNRNHDFLRFCLSNSALKEVPSSHVESRSRKAPT